MALSIGRKKKEAVETDWSEDALLEDEAPPADDGEAATAPTDQTAAEGGEPPRNKKPWLKIALGLAAVLLLVGGAAAYLILTSVPAEEDVPVVVKKPKPAKPDKVVATDPPTSAVAPPGTEAKDVAAGDAGIAPENAQPPAVKSPSAQPPRIVPGPAVPTPVQPPQGMAGSPGRYGSRDVRLAPVGGMSAITPSLQAQLDALWQLGADAKHRGDNEAARAAWQRILELRPGHPGIQEAIDKLPQ